MKADLHVHTHFSKKVDPWPLSRYTPEKAFLQAKKIGLSVVSLTEHDYVHSQDYLSSLEEKFEIRLLPGVEISTIRKKGNQSFPGPHVLGYGVTKPLSERIFFPDVIDVIHSQGGIAVIPHPFYGGYMSLGQELEEYVHLVDGVEILNGFNPLSANEKAYVLSEKYHTPVTAGSDAHFIRNIGKAVTVFSDLLQNAPWQDFLRAIKNRQVTVEGYSYYRYFSITEVVRWAGILNKKYGWDFPL
ncbi:MAG TPA: PHP-associated domain-containing protein [Patescibacteria group bacterium]|nr:PHP-associated domain-containing protein [Patescibacteria group bacterium]